MEISPALAVSDRLHLNVGELDGRVLGANVGEFEGAGDGFNEGDAVGGLVGDKVGVTVGNAVGGEDWKLEGRGEVPIVGPGVGFVVEELGLSDPI